MIARRLPSTNARITRDVLDFFLGRAVPKHVLLISCGMCVFVKLCFHAPLMVPVCTRTLAPVGEIATHCSRYKNSTFSQMVSAQIMF
ncbi:unnamed protein product [Periconia digitata]|uniref:Uncharacterized protein n=1 Tax=Periconia digitata TaxID=1303443 RepID=A0A9W4TZS1_9PLEO|nr:unnamed protein product [Periconia digitata]